MFGLRLLNKKHLYLKQNVILVSKYISNFSAIAVAVTGPGSNAAFGRHPIPPQTFGVDRWTSG